MANPNSDQVGSVTVVIPAYRVKKHILEVIKKIPATVERVIVVDDACPEESGLWVQRECHDPRVEVLFHTENRGVGGATITGYRAALSGSSSIVVKLDGDGQMDPARIARLALPIQLGRADYSKGNRFFNLEDIQNMPGIRIFGNITLSFINKFTSGYWNIVDPTNGFTAIHRDVLRFLPLDKIDPRYFFESDMLFRLNVLRAVVHDVPMPAYYGDEKSNLRVTHTLLNFPLKYINRALKRIFYNYFLRDFNVGSLELIVGFGLTLGGAIFGTWKWHEAGLEGRAATSGTVMLASLPIILGVQLLLSALHYDVERSPKEPLHLQ